VVDGMAQYCVTAYSNGRLRSPYELENAREEELCMLSLCPESLALLEWARENPYPMHKLRDAENLVGMGIWCLKSVTGKNLFQEDAFDGLALEVVLDGMQARGMRILQIHDGDLGLDLKSSKQKIEETAQKLAVLCVARGISLEAVTTDLFGNKSFAGGANTALVEELYKAALAKVLKTLIFAAAYNKAVQEQPAELVAKLPYKRVRTLIGWGGGEEIDWFAKPTSEAWRRRQQHVTDCAEFAADLDVATEEDPLNYAEESKPCEPVRRIVIGTTMAAIASSLNLWHKLPPRLQKIIRLMTNPEIAHENMSFEDYMDAYEVALAMLMLSEVHMNGLQPGGVQDLDLSAKRKEAFCVKWVLRGSIHVPIVLDVKPDRTDGLTPEQRWRVIDQSLESLDWADEVIAVAQKDEELDHLLGMLGTRQIADLTAPMKPRTRKELRQIAGHVYDEAEMEQLRELACASGQACFRADAVIDKIIHRATEVVG